ncbi:MAG: response regulator transcription factor [Treponemataceae bacterium]
MESKIRIVIADDQALFAHLLKTVLETRSTEFEVIGIAGNGLEALELTAALKPDVLLLDLSMPEMDGVRTAQELKRLGDPVRIMVLTTFDDPGPIREVLAIGVGGYVLKDCEPQELFSAIRAVYDGSTSLSPGVIRRLIPAAGPAAPFLPFEAAGADRSKITELLNRREQEILALVAEGLSNKEIGARLFIAEQTIKNNICNINEKLGIHDRSKLVKLAESFVASLPST